MGHKIFFYSRLNLKLAAIFGIREKFINFLFHVVLGSMSSKVSKFSRHRHFNNWSMSMSMCDKVSLLVYRHLLMPVYRPFSEKVKSVYGL